MTVECDLVTGMHHIFGDQSWPMCSCGTMVAVPIGKRKDRKDPAADFRMRNSTHAERLAELDRRAKATP
jgi:hypothetical protein